MTEVEKTARNQVCQDCSENSAFPRTMYVHLLSGDVKEVLGVTEICVTQSQVVLNRGEEAPAVFPRWDVYFACCDADEQPSPF